MRPDERIRQHVEKLNALLRVELGESPVHAWQWSSDLIMRVPRWYLSRPRLIDTDGRELVNYKVEMIERKQMQPEYQNRWVLCQEFSPGARERFRQAIHDAAVPPEWFPILSTLELEGKTPTLDGTWRLIHWLRRERAVSTATMMNEIAEAQARQDLPNDPRVTGVGTDIPTQGDLERNPAYARLRERLEDSNPAFKGKTFSPVLTDKGEPLCRN